MHKGAEVEMCQQRQTLGVGFSLRRRTLHVDFHLETQPNAQCYDLRTSFAVRVTLPKILFLFLGQAMLFQQRHDLIA